MAQWKKYSEGTFPPVGVEIIAYNKKWVNEDFNPKGTRVGFRSDEGDFISAHWWDYQDCYITISRLDCEDQPHFYENFLDNIDPEYWTEIPEFKI